MQAMCTHKIFKKSIFPKMKLIKIGQETVKLKKKKLETSTIQTNNQTDTAEITLLTTPNNEK